MPLKTGTSQSVFKTNLKEMLRAGHPRDQSLAAAYSQKRKSQKKKKGR
jgi:hypothetical protein